MTNLDCILKKQRHYFFYKRPYSWTMGFSSSHVWMWELDNKKAELQRIDAFKLWCLRILLDRESPLDNKKIKPVNAKGNHSGIFTERTNAEAEVLILWPPDVKRQLTGTKKKKPHAGKDWRQEEKGTTEDEMAGWYHRLNGHELEQTLGDGERQGSLECCSPWGCKESDKAQQVNNNKFIEKFQRLL